MVPPEIIASIERLQSERFTGSLTLHFADGEFKLAEEKRSWRPQTLDKAKQAAIA